jgi:hypothetical protein
MTTSIDRDTAFRLYEIYERALGVLREAESTIDEALEGEAHETFMEAHSKVVVGILSRLRGPLVVQFRELDTQRPAGPPDTLLEPEEQGTVAQLTSEQIQQIDDALLANCAASARKVALIASTASMQLRDELPDIPIGYYAQRVQALVAAGRLHARGDLDYMRFSEVSLPSDPAGSTDAFGPPGQA